MTPHRNLTQYALGAIGVLVIAGYLHVIPPSLAVFLAVVVVVVMSQTRKREHRAQYEAEIRQWHAQNPNPQAPWAPPPSLAPPSSNGWSTAATVLAVIAAIAGLAIMAGVVVLVVGFSTGSLKLSNK